jgi:hypothetical protein
MAKSSSKSSRIKVPKRVAGVKIPKTVRKGPVMDFVNSSAGRLLIAEALAAALAMFAYKNADSETGRRIKAGTKDAEAALKRNTARLSFAFGEAVRVFRDSLARPDLPSNGNTGEVIDAEPDETPLETAKKKPPRSSRSHEMPEAL